MKVSVRTLVAAGTATLAVVPAIAEGRAQAAIVARAGSCGGNHAGGGACGGLGRVSLDLGGLSFHEVWREAAGRRWSAGRVEVTPAWDGVDVSVHGLQSAPAPGRDPAPPASSPPAASRQSAPASAPFRVDTRGVPVRIHVDDTVEISRASAQVFIDDLDVEIDAAGTVAATFSARGTVAGIAVASTSPLRAWPVAGPDTLAIDGAIAVGGSDVPLPVRGTVSPGRASLAIRGDGDDARLAIEVEREDGRVALARAEATAFSLDPFWPVLADHPLVRSVGLADGVRVSGTFELAREDGVRAHLQGFELTGLSIDDPKISRERVDFGTLAIDGDAWWQSAERFDAQLTVTHAGASAHVQGSRRGDAIAADLEVARTPCQDLLDAIPDGLAQVLRGTRMRGEVGARVSVSLSLAAMAEIRALPPASIDPLEPPKPGELVVDFPFLEACEVTGDAPGLDLDALPGPYRHRYVDGVGRSRERTMARGAPGYAPLGSVMRVADALVTLEDSRFFDHDGFDRQLLENAWWHNLMEGRIARGASTISQQTARNLYLGVDRSLGRKLQEAFITTRLEHAVDKDRILELYVNIIELGPGIHGVDDAARHVFGKPASSLSVLEALHLASLAPAPHTYAERFADGVLDDAWIVQLREQARRMYVHRRITRDELAQALREPLTLRSTGPPTRPVADDLHR